MEEQEEEKGLAYEIKRDLGPSPQEGHSNQRHDTSEGHLSLVSTLSCSERLYYSLEVHGRDRHHRHQCAYPTFSRG